MQHATISRSHVNAVTTHITGVLSRLRSSIDDDRAVQLAQALSAQFANQLELVEIKLGMMHAIAWWFDDDSGDPARTRMAETLAAQAQAFEHQLFDGLMH